MNTLGNILWVLFGGILVALEYLVASLLLCITIVGIPFGMQTFKLAMLAIWPFGRTTLQHPQKTGCLYTFMNVLWIFIGGLWICITHLILGVLFCITIIGIPFGRQHFKLMALALMPFGKDIVPLR